MRWIQFHCILVPRILNEEPRSNGDQTSPLQTIRNDKRYGLCQTRQWTAFSTTVDSRLSARGLTALRLNRGNVFLKKKFYFP
jgi:hypothetical protein